MPRLLSEQTSKPVGFCYHCPFQVSSSRAISTTQWRNTTNNNHLHNGYCTNCTNCTGGPVHPTAGFQSGSASPVATWERFGQQEMACAVVHRECCNTGWRKEYEKDKINLEYEKEREKRKRKDDYVIYAFFSVMAIILCQKLL
ncbi:hypothetical protein HOY80DRAFT_1060222 [Tuber brumale]|nr:hypothetical protein HOY80DRAFT_1060222 [Tuber brumale]